MSNRLKEIKEELETLTWVKWENRFNVKDNQFPGVYVVAKTKNQVEGKKVDIHDIYYVGMTTSRAGLIGRLNQFDSGIKRGYGHSFTNNSVK